MPLELGQRVTGHRTVEIVLKHYFRPGREDFRETIMSAMPELLTAPTAAPALPAASGTVEAIIGAGGQQEPAGAGDVLEEALAVVVRTPRDQCGRPRLPRARGRGVRESVWGPAWKYASRLDRRADLAAKQ